MLWLLIEQLISLIQLYRMNWPVLLSHTGRPFSTPSQISPSAGMVRRRPRYRPVFCIVFFVTRPRADRICTGAVDPCIQWQVGTPTRLWLTYSPTLTSDCQPQCGQSVLDRCTGYFSLFLLVVSSAFLPRLTVVGSS